VDEKINVLHPDIVSTACEPILRIGHIFLPLVKLIPRDDLLTGIVPVLLLWVGLLFGRNRFKLNFTILIIIMALVAMGCHTVMLLLTRLLFPPMVLVGYAYLSVSFVLFMSGVFAGLGVDAIVSIMNRNAPCQVSNEGGGDPRAYYNLSDAKNFVLQWNSSIKPFIALFLTLTFITLNQYYYIEQNPNLSNILSAALISLLITFVAYLLVKLGFFFSQYVSRVSWKETCKGMCQGLWMAVPSISNWGILTHFKAATLFRIAGGCSMVFTISLPFVYEIAELPSNYLLWILYLECLFLAGISVYYLLRRLEISVSRGLAVLLLIVVCVEMSIVYQRCRQGYFRPGLNLGTNAFAQKPQLSNRIPWLEIDIMGGYRYGPNIYNVYTAIDEILPPKGKTKFNWEDISYIKAYGWRDTIGQLHSFWLKQYLQLYEIGENNLEVFEVLMGLKSGQTLLDFYPQAILKSDAAAKKIFTRPYEKIAPTLESAVFISEPLPEVFRSLQVEMGHLNPLKARPGFEYKVLKYNPNHLEIE
ncbi:MAG: hypothetical protein QMD05_10865, partial [Candidatus Brocadiaceae bacterium]|nr:hypothetical protein [Candidatus Brocadiaceae bacterium]